MYRRFVKPLLDRIVAFFLLIILSPLFIVISLVLWFIKPGKVFFIHQRPGQYGKPFYLIKFRTMNDERDSTGKLLPNIERITVIGRFLRYTSLDEIPQIINVLGGSLSLVGPRPLEMRYMKLYTEEQQKRHNVKPGITGLAQVNGRNGLLWEDRFKFDVWYSENLSFSLDIKILILTIRRVLKQEGVNADELNTVVPFDIYLKSKGESSE